MEHLTDVVRYVDTVAYRMRQVEPKQPFGHAPFVTISRQVGADGHALGEAILRALSRRMGDAFRGWELFDRQLIDMIAHEPRLKVSMRYLLDEEYHSRMTDYLEQALAWQSPQDVVLGHIFRTVRALSGAGRVIIVGRAAACATAGLRGGIHVRLVASEERRLQVVMRRTGLTEKKAKARMKELEHGRAMLARAHFRRDVDDPLLYDAVFNEDRLPFGEIAEWVVSEIEKKAHLLESTTKRTGAEGRA